MTLKLHPATTLPAMYELLRTIEPSFRTLPPADEVEFRVIKAQHFGDCDGEIIRISSTVNGHLITLAATLGHEMFHLLQKKRGISIGHGPEFKRWAKRFCLRCGLDHKSF